MLDATLRIFKSLLVTLFLCTLLIAGLFLMAFYGVPLLSRALDQLAVISGVTTAAKLVWSNLLSLP